MKTKCIHVSNVQELSMMVTKATSGEPTDTASCAKGRLRVALKYSSGSKKLSTLVVTGTATITEPAGMTTLVDTLV